MSYRPGVYELPCLGRCGARFLFDLLGQNGRCSLYCATCKPTPFAPGAAVDPPAAAAPSPDPLPPGQLALF